ncbi:HlyD family secretion protein [Roseibium sediminis]|uniref:HlyD family secretion protein n=1 Tax=Roseibium sediminis TaxID=1775174 RepID=UPI00123DCC59|nr:hypothetical protein [Roseibium sediminis]
MKRLNKRTRTDAHKNDRRTVKKGYGRWVYLGLIGVLGLSVLDYVWGDMVLFRANGIVAQDRVDIEARYVGHLDEFPLQIGQKVEKGEVLAKISSLEIADRLAELKLRQSELNSRLIENQEAIRIGKKLLPFAEQRLMESREMKKAVLEAKSKGLITTDRLLEVFSENNGAEEAVIRIREELESKQNLVRGLRVSMEDVETALAQLALLYADGVVTSPVDGVLGSEVPVRGQTFLTGERILSVYTGQRFIQAYLPNRHLFPVTVGEQVLVYSGARTVQGVVEDVLPVSDELPKEFQNSFKPPEKSQLARIRVEELDLPLHTKITIKRKMETIEGLGRALGDKLAEIWSNSGETLPDYVPTGKIAFNERIENVFRAVEHVGGETLHHDQADVRRVSLSLWRPDGRDEAE